MTRPRIPIPTPAHALALIALLCATLFAACGESAPAAPTGTESAAQSERAPREPAESVATQQQQAVQAVQDEADSTQEGSTQAEPGQDAGQDAAEGVEAEAEQAGGEQQEPAQEDGQQAQADAPPAVALPYNIKGDPASARVHIINYGDFQ